MGGDGGGYGNFRDCWLVVGIIIWIGNVDWKLILFVDFIVCRGGFGCV